MSSENPPDDGGSETIDVIGKHVFLTGETFQSFEELEERLKKHSEEDFVHYWRRDTRTIKGALTKTSRLLAERLKYYSMRYACVHGGQKFARRGHGQRKKQTMRFDCPAYITIRATKCGQLLEVIDVCNQHNHPISELESRTLPQNRRLPTDVRKEVLLMLHVHIDRKRILEYIRCKTGKQLSNKNLINLKTSLGKLDSELVNTTDDTKANLLRLIKSVCNENEAKTGEYETQQQQPERFLELQVDDEEKTKQVGDSNPDGFSQVVEEIIVEDESYEQFQNFPIELGDPFGSEGNDLNDVVLIDEPHNTLIAQPEADGGQNSKDLSVCVKCPSVASGNPLPSDGMSEAETSIDTIPKPLVIKRNSKYFTRLPRNAKPKSASNRYCKHCGLNAKLVRMQIAVLQAEKDKLVEETHILRLTKERLMVETGIGFEDDDMLD